LAIPLIHPLIPEQQSEPGIFMVNMGAANVVVFVVEHIVFGIIVGSIYGSVVHPRARPVVA
ncbi:MAG: hypothetical protein ACT4O2_13560, partial [Beijerinckiaceae bacterium]